MANKPRRLEPPENPNTNDGDVIDRLRDMQVIQKIRDVVIKIGNPNLGRPLSDQKMKFIEERIREIYPVFRTPSHPPYTALIEGAIMKLNDNGGSSGEAISECIKAEYGDDLPWAHKMYLSYHLGKLVADKEILVNFDGYYSIPVENPDFKRDTDLEKELLLLPQPKRHRRRSERQAKWTTKWIRRKDNVILDGKDGEIKKIGGNEAEISGHDNVIGEVNEEEIGLHIFADKQNQAQKEHNMVVEEENGIEEIKYNAIVVERKEQKEHGHKENGEVAVREMPLENTHGRRKQNGFPATLMIASPELNLRSRSFLKPEADFGKILREHQLYHHRRFTRSQKTKLTDLIKPSESQVKNVEELSIVDELLQQELQHCPTPARLKQTLDKIAKLKQAPDKITREALPSDNRRDQEQPSEQAKNTNKKMLGVWQNCHRKSPEGKSRAQEELLPSGNEHNEEQLQQLPHQGCRRPWKKSVMDSAMEKPLPIEPDSDATIKTSTAYKAAQEGQLLQQPRRGRGRPRKKLDMDSTMEKLLPLKSDLDATIRKSTVHKAAQEGRLLSENEQNEDQLQQPPRRGRGRPPKKQLVMDLITEKPNQQQQQP
ncbi:Linker histone H1/H5, domain H15 [Dillenia turbinata]|uniref:Linker histone H1/H5, domain H15 n=1 Tax=Dillenia turbinata TaxID=194707 RepID=A0AAN8V2N8_9MAGN